MRVTIPVASSRTLHASESGGRISNEGATELVQLILPPCAPDLEFEFLIVEPHQLRVDLDDNVNELFVYEQGGASTNAANLHHNGVGSVLRIYGTHSKKWIACPVADDTWGE